MSPLILLSLILQIGCCVHVVRSGRPLYWIFILLIFSFVAVLIYVLVAVVPDLRNDPSARRGLRKVRDQLDPQRSKREAGQQLNLADTPENRRRLADEHLAQGEYREAADLYESAMRGLYRDDPPLMLGLAQAQYGLGQPLRTRQTLEALIAANPTFHSHEGHLLYARAVDDSGDTDAALHEYEAMIDTFAGEEARVRYALLLKRLGRNADAAAQLTTVLKRSEASPRYYQRAQREWIEQARRELAQLPPAN